MAMINANLSPSVIALNLRQFFVKRAINRCFLVAAVSGGVDSTALLLGLADLRDEGFPLHAAHVNHHLRGAESDADEAFVRTLCARLDVPLDVADGTLDEALVRARGIEAAAREIRYRRLLEIRERTGARFVATAHQKNDQAETVLMRLLTGSGIAGLRGIHPVRQDGVIRPMLDVPRSEIEAFLRERGVTPRLDRSNEDPRFLRNRVRLLIRELGATDNLAAVAAQAREQWPILERAIDEAERPSAEVREHETRFTTWPEDPWLRAALLQRHIRRLDPEARDFDAQRIEKELDSIRRISVTKTLELKREGETLILRHKTKDTARVDYDLPLAPDIPTPIPALATTIHLAEHRKQPATSNQQQFQLPSNATPTFVVRNRRPGDRFSPLGLPFSKKLNDFLIDRKIPAEIRDRLPLLIWNGEIVWVAGVEISERFKVTASEGTIYEVWTDPELNIEE
jgi:tRNA(Ile)-lysidine synthase